MLVEIGEELAEEYLYPKLGKPENKIELLKYIRLYKFLMNFKVLRNIFRQINKLETSSINQNGKFLLIENVNEFPLRINTFLIKDSFNDCKKSIIRTT